VLSERRMPRATAPRDADTTRPAAGRVTADGQPLARGTALEMDAIEARIIDQIFRWFASGVSLWEIAHRLNEQMVPFPAEPTRRGPRRNGWASSGVRGGVRRGWEVEAAS